MLQHDALGRPDIHLLTLASSSLVWFRLNVLDIYGLILTLKSEVSVAAESVWSVSVSVSFLVFVFYVFGFG